MAQPFLHDRQHFGIVARLGVQHALGRETRLEEPGREQVAAAHGPQHRAGGARGDRGGEQHGGGVVAPDRRAGRDLVQRVEPEPPVRQP